LNHSEIVSFIWGVADLIRDTFKRGKYQDVILPLTVAHIKNRFRT
jgi:type I restriction enzyme M protein